MITQSVPATVEAPTSESVNELVTVTQLPVIVEKLNKAKESIKRITDEAASLVCTEETVRTVKNYRTNLNKQFTEFETCRKKVKNQIMKPYTDFEATYKDCILTPFSEADKKLAAKINEVEAGLKSQKESEIRTYFNEYRESLNVGEKDAVYSDANINVTLSASVTSLKEQAKAYVEKVNDDISLINTYTADPNLTSEIVLEYRKSHNAAIAIQTVTERRKQIDETLRIIDEKKAASQATAATEEIAQTAAEQATIDAEPIFTPMYTNDGTASPNAAEPILDETKTAETAQPEPEYTLTFAVTAPLSKLKALKNYLDEGKYKYHD